jgi:AcrR family transcriptional regulator
MRLASIEGVGSLTIGRLARELNISKSGVFAHFGSREDLQIAVVKLYHHHFEQEVFYPSMKEPRGLPRLQAMFARWVRRVSVEIASGCIYISGAVEYDDRPGAIREELAGMVRTWQGALRRCVVQTVEMGHLGPNTDPDQLVYEMYDMTEEESAPLLAFLFQHQVKPEFTCRFTWRLGSIAFWDNRAAQHYPLNDYHGYRRILHRITLAGDEPV